MLGLKMVPFVPHTVSEVEVHCFSIRPLSHLQKTWTTIIMVFVSPFINSVKRANQNLLTLFISYIFCISRRCSLELNWYENGIGRYGSRKRCENNFLDVTVHHTKTTGKLRHFITFFKKDIQTWWTYTSFSACLWKACMDASWCR